MASPLFGNARLNIERGEYPRAISALLDLAREQYELCYSHQAAAIDHEAEIVSADQKLSLIKARIWSQVVGSNEKARDAHHQELLADNEEAALLVKHIASTRAGVAYARALSDQARRLGRLYETALAAVASIQPRPEGQ